MATFNLQHFMVKEAMGAKQYRYRDQTHWNRLDDVVQGHGEAVEEIGADGQTIQRKDWKTLKTEIPSLNGVLYEILNFKAGREAFFQARYGISKAEVRDIFQMFVGYHPFYGCYALSVGPYFASATAWKQMSGLAEEQGLGEITPEVLDGAIASAQERLQVNENDKEAQKLLGSARSVKADKANKFCYFTRRFQRATETELVTAAKKMVGALTKKLVKATGISPEKLNLDWQTDLQLVAKSSSGDKGDANLKFKSHTYKNTSPETADGQKLLDKQPILGTNSAYFLNAKALHKVMTAASADGGWTDIYNQALQQVATEEAINPENINAVMSSDVSLMRNVIKKAIKLQDDMVKSGNPAAASMKKIPPFNLMGKGGRVGAQRFDALKTRPDQAASARLRLDVLQACVELNGSQDPVKIANLLQSKRDQPQFKSVMAKGVIDPTSIKPFIDLVKADLVLKNRSGRKIGLKTFKQLMTESQNDLNTILENTGTKYNEGFSDLETCYKQACFYLYSPGSDAIDPASKAKVSALYMPPPDLLHRDEVGENPTSQKMDEMRQAARQQGSEKEMLEQVRVASPKELELELGGEAALQVTEETPDNKADELDLELGEGEQDETKVEEPAVPVTDLTPPADEEVAAPAEVPADAPVEEAPAADNQFGITEVPQTKIPNELQLAPQADEPEELDEFGQPKKKQVKQAPVANNVLGNTLGTLLKIAKELDDHGRASAAEEVHAVIRKYQKGI